MPPFTREIECTAYCSCGYCCNWEWGLALPGPFYLGFSPSWCPVHLRKRNKGYWTASTLTGSPYYGLTADGSVPAQVEDRGSAIKGPGKIDLYHCSHKEALKWGRQKLQVVVVLPGQSTLDSLKIPRPIKDVLKGLNWLRNLFV
ncbi:uncharacterized protein LOC131050157 isoform X4 [Cryptomeria japonica]|uniref:uncharacterized protein LOC131050157 isoform X4 n=1 Tax=Cryptomeria japonica TaxID=3369 RepID=UPI0027D9F9BC|nr:uncharacterized protein LOC131050157 isoform X4 [Cryptomeria japonica]